MKTIQTIWKYDVPAISRGGCSRISMPVGAKVLSVQVQGTTPVMWASVDPAAPKKDRFFQIVGTGWNFDPSGLEFVGTFQIDGGSLVFHLFERVHPTE
jgi:hypothetical protein